MIHGHSPNSRIIVFCVLFIEIHAPTDMNTGSGVVRLPAPGIADHVCDRISFAVSMISHKDGNTKLRQRDRL